MLETTIPNDCTAAENALESLRAYAKKTATSVPARDHPSVNALMAGMVSVPTEDKKLKILNTRR